MGTGAEAATARATGHRVDTAVVEATGGDREVGHVSSTYTYSTYTYSTYTYSTYTLLLATTACHCQWESSQFNVTLEFSIIEPWRRTQVLAEISLISWLTLVCGKQTFGCPQCSNSLGATNQWIWRLTFGPYDHQRNGGSVKTCPPKLRFTLILCSLC